MFEFEEFKKEVINTYREKLSQHVLDIKLENPTPGNLRNFSLKLFANGLSREDIQVFSDFFDPTNRYSDLETGIRRFELDKLKPLKNFMTEKTTNPDEGIVKLLAILIQFAPRPFIKWRELRNSKKINYQKYDSEQEADAIPLQPVAEEPENIEKVILENGIMDGIEERNHIIPEERKLLIDLQQELIAANKFNKELYEQVPWERTVAGKPPSENQTINNKAVAQATAFNLVSCLLGGAIFMLLLFAILYLLIPKYCTCWVEVQYVAIECQQYEQPIKMIAFNRLGHFKTDTSTDYITAHDTERAEQDKDGTKPFEPTVYKAIHEPGSIRAVAKYIIVLYAGEQHMASRKVE
ncbi:hypothetical protein ACFX5U_15230 [Sphingobacterium sp. SG20118]|uniref:hypothetical protein n=1 Tax=Sphingobacterium sp. SG20118 TaxID=3367156 RepID=UPI0037DFBE63